MISLIPALFRWTCSVSSVNDAGMTAWLVAATIAVSGGAAGALSLADTEPVPTTTTTTTTVVEADTWTDPTIGVEYPTATWAPTGTYPNGAYWNDECIPSERWPGFGSTRIGAMPCTPVSGL